MLNFARIFIFLTTLAFGHGMPASAQSWQYSDTLSENGMHVVTYSDFSSIYYNPLDLSWYVNIGLIDVHSIDEPLLKFTYSDGSGPTYSLKKDLIKLTPLEGKNVSIVKFPVQQEGIDLIQAASSFTFITSKREFTVPLTGSRAALSYAADRVRHDQAIKDDEQHAIAQAESDAQQADARADAALAECDRLTAHKWDHNRESSGVEWAALNGQAGVLACSEARDLKGEHGRILFQLGRAYDKVENPTTLKLMQYAAWELSYPAAFYHLGTLHEDGLYTPKNKTKAKRNYEEGAALNHVPSRYALGRVLFDEATTEQEKRSAEQLIFKAATEGYPFAHEKMGILAFKGDSQIISKSFAHKYLAIASDAKMANATFYLSKAYRDGIGVDQDDEIAYVLLRRAADQGSAGAKEELGG
jgi:TPR repeat protein